MKVGEGRESGGREASEEAIATVQGMVARPIVGSGSGPDEGWV